VDALEDAIRARPVAVAVLLLPRRKFCSLPDRYLRYQIVTFGTRSLSSLPDRSRSGLPSPRVVGWAVTPPDPPASIRPRTASESCAVGCRHTKALLFRAAALEGTLHGRATATQMTRIRRELRVGAEYPYRPNTAACVAIPYHDGNNPIRRLPAWFTRRGGGALGLLLVEVMPSRGLRSVWWLTC
jgi:hypothetical protein